MGTIKLPIKTGINTCVSNIDSETKIDEASKVVENQQQSWSIIASLGTHEFLLKNFFPLYRF